MTGTPWEYPVRMFFEENAPSTKFPRLGGIVENPLDREDFPEPQFNEVAQEIVNRANVPARYADDLVRELAVTLSIMANASYGVEGYTNWKSFVTRVKDGEPGEPRSVVAARIQSAEDEIVHLNKEIATIKAAKSK